MASRYFEPEIERRSRAAMTRWQAARLRAQVRHAAAHSPFYRDNFKAAGVSAARVRDLDDLRHLPFTTKDELKANQAAVPAAPAGGGVRGLGA
jgi:phenylacetate-CoA ligase